MAKLSVVETNYDNNELGLQPHLPATLGVWHCKLALESAEHGVVRDKPRHNSLLEIEASLMLVLFGDSYLDSLII